MFVVINKSKILSYIVVFSSVLVLFFTVSTIQSKNTVINNRGSMDNKKKNVKDIQSTQASANILKDEPISCINTDKKIVSLTINCEEKADDIDKILDILDKCDVKVTFFVLGEWAEKNPEAVKKISARGHEIGNHSFSHKKLNNYSQKEIENEILKCSKLIKALTGTEVKLFSAPYGEYSENVIKSAKEMNCIPIKWSIDTLDYENIDGDQIWDRINNRINNGSIILMHNGTENSANSLEMIINRIQEKGFKIVTVSDLIKNNNN